LKRSIQKGTHKTYSTALTKLIKRVKKLKQTIKTSQARRRVKVVISDAEEDEEDSSEQGKSLIEEMDLDARISLVPPHVANQGMFDDTQVSHQPEEQLGVFSVVKVLADAAEQRRDVENVQTYTKRRRAVSTGSGGVSTTSELVSTTELAQKVHEEEQARFNAEQEVKFKAEQEQERLDHDLVVADKDFVQQLQAGEKAEAKRNKPITPAQQKEYMSTYIKNQEGGYTLKQLKALSFEEVKEIFEATMRKVQSFVPMDFELEVQRLKRAGQDVVEEPAKRQRAREASRSVQERTGEEPKVEELSQEQLHQMMMVIPVEEKIIRVEGHTEAYQTFDDMLKKFDRDDLDKLWNLRYMHDTLNWRLYDTCGVHHVSTERGHDIYMLVEKDYPLTKALMTLMLCNKPRVDQYSNMAEELLNKIFILVERPRQ
ncbi:hypothetical protein Tco_1161136, partial [Tanacetum coccineum]